MASSYQDLGSNTSNPGQSNPGPSSSGSGSNSGSYSGPVLAEKKTGQGPRVRATLSAIDSFLDERVKKAKKNFEEAKSKPGTSQAELAKLEREVKQIETEIKQTKNTRGVCLAYSIGCIGSSYAGKSQQRVMRNHFIAARVSQAEADLKRNQGNAQLPKTFSLISEIFSLGRNKKATENKQQPISVQAQPNGQQADLKDGPKNPQATVKAEQVPSGVIYHNDVRADLIETAIIQFSQHFVELMDNEDNIAGFLSLKGVELATSKQIEDQGGFAFPTFWSGVFARNFNTKDYFSLLNKYALATNKDLSFVMYGELGRMSLTQEGETKSHAIGLCFKAGPNPRWEFWDANEQPYMFEYSTDDSVATTAVDPEKPELKNHLNLNGNLNDLARIFFKNIFEIIYQEQQKYAQGEISVPKIILTTIPVTTQKRKLGMDQYISQLHQDEKFISIHNPYLMYPDHNKRKEALYAAVKKGNLDFIKRLIDKADSKDSIRELKADLINQNLIKEAIKQKQEKIVIFLVSSGLVQFNFSEIALMAYQNNLLKAFYNIVKAKENKKALLDLNQFPGIQKPERRAYLEILIAFGADINKANPQGKPLHIKKMKESKAGDDQIEFERSKLQWFYAAKMGAHAVLPRLIGRSSEAEGLFANTCDENGKAALSYAIEAKDVETIKTLVQLGADQLVKDGTRMPLMHHLITNGDTKLLRTCAYQGLGLNQQDEVKRETPLHIAVREKNYDALKALLRCGANVNRRNKEGWSPLCLAMQLKNVEAFKILIEHGRNIDINMPEKNRYTPLFYAANLCIQPGGDRRYLVELFKHNLITPKHAREEKAINADKATAIMGEEIITLRGYFKDFPHLLEEIIKQAEQEKNISEWFKAAKKGDFDKIKEIYAKDNSIINLMSPFKKRALDYVLAGHYSEDQKRKIEQFLRDRGAEPPVIPPKKQKSPVPGGLFDRTAAPASANNGVSAPAKKA